MLDKRNVAILCFAFVAYSMRSIREDLIVGSDGIRTGSKL